MKIKIVSCCIAILTLVASAAFGQWTSEYQAEKSEAYYSVHFPTSLIGYFSGSPGAIYKTTDQGGTWVQQTSPTTEELFDIFFKDASNGFAVGDNGTIIYTTDGGTNWNMHAQSGVITTADLDDISFIGTSGWIAGNAGTVLLSTDGGTTWGPATTVAHTDDVNEIAMSDALNGYAACDGDGIMYTTDGGVNWTASTLNLGPYPYTRNDIEAILAVSGTVGIATGWGSSVGPQPTIILKTTDGGQTWAIANTNYHWNTYTYGYGIAHLSTGDLVIVGGGSSSAGIILRSTDNGDTWAAQKPFTGEDLRAVASPPGTGSLVAVGDEGLVAKSVALAIDWNAYFDPGTGFQGWLEIGNLGAGVVTIGANSHILTAMDDGTTKFSVVAPQNWAPTALEDIAVFGSRTWYVCGRNYYLCKTSDAGAHWTQLTHNISNFYAFYGMHWFDLDNGILVGEENRDDAIWTTDDGGQTLNLIWHNVTSEQFNSISIAPDGLHGVVAGDNGGVAYTSDGGANWTLGTYAATTADFEECHMVDATTAWAVGDAGLMAKTTDGGANWSAVTAPVSVTIMNIYFHTPDLGYLCGDDGAVFYTDDGGVNWYDISITLPVTTWDVNAVYFNSSNGKVYVGCDYAYLASRDDVATKGETPDLPFVLGQNFPNPFNPSTRIDFTVPKAGRVSLDVYDVNGRIVATILDKDMDAGQYKVSFKADRLASGVYFYRLRTGDRIETRKMILLR